MQGPPESHSPGSGWETNRTAKHQGHNHPQYYEVKSIRFIGLKIRDFHLNQQFLSLNISEFVDF